MNPQSSPTTHTTALSVAGWSLLTAAVASAVASWSGGSAVPFARVLVLVALGLSLGLVTSMLWLPVAGWLRVASRLSLLVVRPLPFARSELLSGGGSALDALRSPLRRRLLVGALFLLLTGVGVSSVTALWPQPQPVTIGLRSGEPVDHGQTSDGPHEILVQLPFALQETGLPDSNARRVSVAARDIKTGTKTALELGPASEVSLRGGTLRLAGWSASTDIASAKVRVGDEKGEPESVVLPFGTAVAWKGLSLTLREGRSDFFGADGLAVAVEVAAASGPGRVVWVFSGKSGAAMAARQPVVGAAMVVESVTYDPIVLLRWTPDATQLGLVLLWVGFGLAFIGWLLLALVPPFVVGRDGDYLLVGVRGGRSARALAFAEASLLTGEQQAELSELLASMEVAS